MVHFELNMEADADGLCDQFSSEFIHQRDPINGVTISAPMILTIVGKNMEITALKRRENLMDYPPCRLHEDDIAARHAGHIKATILDFDIFTTFKNPNLSTEERISHLREAYNTAEESFRKCNNDLGPSRPFIPANLPNPTLAHGFLLRMRIIEHLIAESRATPQDFRKGPEAGTLRDMSRWIRHTGYLDHLQAEYQLLDEMLLGEDSDEE